MQIIKCLQQTDADYSAEYDARQFGLPTPDSINLRNQYGHEVIAYEICPAIPVGIVICISGQDAPSASAYYGHATEFYKLGYATFTMDVSNHSKTAEDKRYEEVKDVQAVIDKCAPDFASITLTYEQNNVYENNKIFYAAIEVSNPDWIQAERFKITVVQNV